MGTHKVIIGPSPLESGEQMWRLLCSSPGAASERCYAMADQSKSWPTTQRGSGGQTTDGAIVWAAGLEQTVAPVALDPSW